jgi:hypothetical protein
MKTTITISGQIGGNHKLLNALSNYDNYTKGQFYGFDVKYASKLQAQKDLASAFKKFKDDEPTASRIVIYRDRGGRAYKVIYDASTMQIN